MAASTNSPRENNLNLPNLITFSRLLLSLVLFGLMSLNMKWALCAGMFVFAVLTDVLDGWIARKYKLITQLGRIMDPFADKFITGGVFVFLLPYAESGVTPWMVIIVLGREMLVTSLRGFLEQRGADFSASFTGKLKMFLQCAALTVALLSMDLPFMEWCSSIAAGLPDQVILLRAILLWTMVAVTVWSGWDYVLRGIQILKRES
ncbi:MAG: CDP-diacylglycerol--glycerol-3-phosphate 3-phosphatidyltransferase [Planctomycetaceae bacterium]